MIEETCEYCDGPCVIEFCKYCDGPCAKDWGISCAEHYGEMPG